MILFTVVSVVDEVDDILVDDRKETRIEATIIGRMLCFRNFFSPFDVTIRTYTNCINIIIVIIGLIFILLIIVTILILCIKCKRTNNNLKMKVMNT